MPHGPFGRRALPVLFLPIVFATVFALKSITVVVYAQQSMNVALETNGGSAVASSIYSPGYAEKGVINGDRKGLSWGNGGGWNDQTASAFPDWIQINFAGSKTINDIDVFTLQDNYSNPSDPTPNQVFSSYGIIDFDVQYWTGSTWAVVPGGHVVGNNLVWRKFTFSNITTTNIRVVVYNGAAYFSRIVEIEAWTPASQSNVNVALEGNGGNAIASSIYSPGYAEKGVINGDRKGLSWGNGGGWNDQTASAFPDWIQINFAGSKTINDIDVFTLQDNYSNPSDPTPNQVFSSYGIIDFDVQYWTGSTWAVVPGGHVVGNNLVWRKFTFSNITTTAIRVVVYNAAGYFSRIVEIEAWTPGTSTSDGPIHISAANPQYFEYNGSVLTLVGTSAEYLCHVDQTDADDAVNFCTWKNHNTFFTDLQNNGLNKIRMWLALNHSPGSKPTDSPGTTSNLNLTPYESEAPFIWDDMTKLWNIDLWSEGTGQSFFSRVKQTIQDAGRKGVIVEVTLFDAFSGAFENSPWNDRNNSQSPSQSLSSENYFTSFDSVTTDSQPGNRYIRTKQREFITKIVTTLNSLDNFYWEIANEPDNLPSADPASIMNWHQDMINQIRLAESTLPKKHLIAVNFSQTRDINWAATNPDINIINGHYLTINDLPGAPRLGAMEMISPGLKPADLATGNKLLGFNEGHITNATQATLDSARAEAWEFMSSGGGLLDHLGYLSPSPVSPTVDPAELHRQLGVLARFLNGGFVNGVYVPGVNLGNMLRQTGNPPTWCPNLPPYGTQISNYRVFWGAMQWTRNEYVLYIHHSNWSDTAFKRYDPVTGSYSYTLNLNLGSQPNMFTAEWIDPRTGLLLPVTGPGTNNRVTFYWSGTGTYTLPPSPSFPFDAVLHIKRQ